MRFSDDARNFAGVEGGMAFLSGADWLTNPYRHGVMRRIWLEAWLRQAVSSHGRDPKHLAQFPVERLPRDNADWTPEELELVQVARLALWPPLSSACIAALLGRSARGVRLAVHHHKLRTRRVAA